MIEVLIAGVFSILAACASALLQHRLSRRETTPRKRPTPSAIPRLLVLLLLGLAVGAMLGGARDSINAWLVLVAFGVTLATVSFRFGGGWIKGSLAQAFLEVFAACAAFTTGMLVTMTDLGIRRSLDWSEVFGIQFAIWAGLIGFSMLSYFVAWAVRGKKMTPE
jgi:hypothetical protein